MVGIDGELHSKNVGVGLGGTNGVIGATVGGMVITGILVVGSHAGGGTVGIVLGTDHSTGVNGTKV
jgi:hypothetical protein